VARRYDLNANLLFNWRRRYQAGALSGESEETALLPIRVATAVDERPKHTDRNAELEVVLAQGHRVRIRGAVDPTVLRAALEVLSR
jgi:transposase